MNQKDVPGSTIGMLSLAARAGVRHLILTHLRGHMDASPEIHAGMLAEAEAAFGGSVEIAEDLASLTL